MINYEKNLRIFKKYFDQVNSTFKDILYNEQQRYTIFLPSNRAMKNYLQLLNTETEKEAIDKFNQIIWRHISMTPSWIKRSADQTVDLKIKSMYRSNNKYDVIEVMIPSKKTKGLIKISEYNAQLLTMNEQTFNGTVHIVDQVFSDEMKIAGNEDLKFPKKAWKTLQTRWAKNKVTPTTATKKTTSSSTLSTKILSTKNMKSDKKKATSSPALYTKIFSTKKVKSDKMRKKISTKMISVTPTKTSLLPTISKQKL